MNTYRKTAAPSECTDIYTRITSKIVADLEAGTPTWLQPWAAGHAAGPIHRPLRSTGQHYQGINVLMLWATASERGYACPIWMTYNQAQELGGQVRKGEHGTQVVYANTFTKTETNDAGEEEERAIPFLRGYTVFNCEQIEGLPGHFYALAQAPVQGLARDEAAEQFFAAKGATIRHGGNSAYYRISEDAVQMPPFESFRDRESYYATLAHEMTHWTRHTTRLDRDLGRKRFGDAGYAMEELVAEIGAAFLCADLGLTLEPRADHAAYIASWLQVLKQDTRAIFSAAAHAERAVAFLHGFQ